MPTSRSATFGIWENCQVETHRYEVIIYWSDEDEAFVAEVPKLPGCTAHGLSQSAALDSIHEAMTLWINTAREFGDPVPVPKGRRLQLA